MGEPPSMMMASSDSRLWIFSAMVMASLSWVMVGISGGIQRRRGSSIPDGNGLIHAAKTIRSG